jgi:uncharacterized protein YchJ
MLVSRMRLNQTRVRPDQICPCGSGKRFKSCHGVRGG